MSNLKLIKDGFEIVDLLSKKLQPNKSKVFAVYQGNCMMREWFGRRFNRMSRMFGNIVTFSGGLSLKSMIFLLVIWIFRELKNLFDDKSGFTPVIQGFIVLLIIVTLIKHLSGGFREYFADKRKIKELEDKVIRKKTFKKFHGEYSVMVIVYLLQVVIYMWVLLYSAFAGQEAVFPFILLVCVIVPVVSILFSLVQNFIIENCKWVVMYKIDSTAKDFVICLKKPSNTRKLVAEINGKKIYVSSSLKKSFVRKENLIILGYVGEVFVRKYGTEMEDATEYLNHEIEYVQIGDKKFVFSPYDVDWVEKP